MSPETKQSGEGERGGIPSRFDEWLKENWRHAAFGGVLVFGVSVSLLYYALSGPGRESNDAVSFDLPAATSSEGGATRALDGVLVDEEVANLLPLGVIVENSIEAWPLSGISKANLVIEAPAEGSITRFLTFYDASTTADRIGPVRSARPYYVEWAHGMNALFSHVGGSPAGLALIANLKSEGFRDLNQFFDSPFFWRSAQQPMPHNVYTRTDLLIEGAERREFKPSEFRPWQYLDANANSTGTSDVLRVAIPYDGVYRAHYEYDEAQHDYIRYQNGVLQKDEDGEWIRVKNVVVILTSAIVLDHEGRLDLRTTGKGPALIFHEGNKIEAFWNRRDGQHIRFETVDGLDVPLARGTTWISVLTKQGQFNKVVGE